MRRRDVFKIQEPSPVAPTEPSSTTLIPKQTSPPPKRWSQSLSLDGSTSKSVWLFFFILLHTQGFSLDIHNTFRNSAVWCPLCGVVINTKHPQPLFWGVKGCHVCCFLTHRGQQLQRGAWMVWHTHTHTCFGREQLRQRKKKHYRSEVAADRAQQFNSGISIILQDRKWGWRFYFLWSKFGAILNDEVGPPPINQWIRSCWDSTSWELAALIKPRPRAWRPHAPLWLHTCLSLCDQPLIDHSVVALSQ